jgi:hypothetical protein
MTWPAHRTGQRRHLAATRTPPDRPTVKPWRIRASFEDHPLSEQATEYRLTALDLARAKQSAMREQGIVIKKRDPYQIAAADPKSLRKAVNAKCWDCQGGGADPNTRQAVGQCGITDCSLWPVRPWQEAVG